MKTSHLPAANARIPSRPFSLSRTIRRQIVAQSVGLAILTFVGPLIASAAVIAAGDVSPSNPATWTSSTSAYIGNLQSGSLDVSAASTNTCAAAYVGYAASGSGGVTVDGAGSTWTEDVLAIGSAGNGTLSVTNGGAVVSGGFYGEIVVGDSAGSTGSVQVNGAGSTWTMADVSIIGNAGAGSLSISNGGSANSTYVQIGGSAGGVGTATVDGSTASWTLSNGLYVGGAGTGTLHLTNGATVNSITDNIGGGVGALTVDGVGSAWNDKTLYLNQAGSAAVSLTRGGKLTSTQSVYVNGGTATVDGLGSTLTTPYLRIGGTTAVTNAALLNASSVNIDQGQLLITGPGSTLHCYGGYTTADNSTLTISRGGLIDSGSAGYVTVGGVTATGNATVLIDGAGSEWTGNYFRIGYGGNTTFRVLDGGTLAGATSIQGYSYLGQGGTTTLTVGGQGSSWTQSCDLALASAADLYIGGGATVTASNLTINSASVVSITAGDGSALTIGGGTGTITDGWSIRINAAPEAVAGATYTPIVAGTWAIAGGNPLLTYQALGGKWSNTTHSFTASPIQLIPEGQAFAFNRSATQRIQATDTPTAKSIIFDVSATGATNALYAKLVNDPALNTLLTANDDVLLNGWTFGNYAPVGTTYISMNVGPDLSGADLSVWQHTATGGWTLYSAPDLTYDGSWAGFVIGTYGSGDGYALAVAAPEPASFTLWCCAAIVLVKRSRTKWLC